MTDTGLAAARALVADDAASVEAMLSEALSSPVEALDRVAGRLLASGGKRFRAVLCLVGARAAGVDPGAASTVAAAAELVHAASLCHDDVLDRGELRRGRATVRAEFGDALSILLGDLCLVRAFALLDAPGLAGCGAALGRVVVEMAEGEVLQAGRTDPAATTVEDCLRVAEAKTGALLGWCATAGGLAPAPVRGLLDRFGRDLGRVYQIVDDVLDLAGGDAGKTPLQDLRGGIPTLPLVVAAAGDPAIAARISADRDGRAVAEIEAAIRSGGALDRCRELARREADRASDALEELPAGPGRDALRELAIFAAERHG